MAEYHLNVSVFSRSQGTSSIFRAAYVARTKLRDERTGETWDYSRKGGLEHREILAPPGALPWVFDRHQLWNRVERAEKRCDSLVAREVEFMLPRELSREAQLAVARAYITENFVAHGMVADWALHDENNKPHVHALLTTRDLRGESFGNKRRDWDDFLNKKLIYQWRAAWEHAANRALAAEGHEARIDHRSYAARGIELEPQPKRYRLAKRSEAAAHARALAQDADVAALRERNGRRILARPELVLELLTSKRATFSERDLQRVIHQHTWSPEQFEAAMWAVKRSPELIALGEQEDGTLRYSTRKVRRVERAAERESHLLAQRAAHRVQPDLVEQGIRGCGATLNVGQRAAVQHITTGPDLAIVEGIAGSGKSRMLDAARLAWEAQGYIPCGGALAAIAAKGLQNESHIPARTLHAWLQRWETGREELTARHVFVLDEAGMVGTELFGRVVAEVRRTGAKLVLVGDTQQLRPIDHGAPMRVLAERYGAAKLTQVVRQTLPWQQRLTVAFARNDATAALETYHQNGRIHQASEAAAAHHAIVDAWDRERQLHPGSTSLLLAFRRKDVHRLNELARAKRREGGELGEDHLVRTHRGARHFATGDRLYFLRNDERMQVANGTLGTVESIRGTRLAVRLDDHRQLIVDTRSYCHLDHGYAATIHKSQGATVDHAFVLASRYMDASATYVAMSRHRRDAHLYYATEDFRDVSELVKTLARNKVELTAGETARVAAARLAARFGDELSFAELSDVRREELLNVVRDGVVQPTTNQLAALRQLRPVMAAERDARDARRELAACKRALDDFERDNPVRAALRTGGYQELVQSVAAAERQDQRARARLEAVECDPKLLARARKLASARNRTLRDAHQRLQLLEERARLGRLDQELAAIAQRKNERGPLRYRAVSAIDDGRMMRFEAEETHGKRQVLVLCDPRVPHVRVIADATRCARPPEPEGRWHFHRAGAQRAATRARAAAERQRTGPSRTH